MKTFLDGIVPLKSETAPAPAVLAEGPEPFQTLAPATPLAWIHQADADRLLSHLRARLDEIRIRRHRGEFPPELATITGDAIAIAERLVRDHELEESRGWNVINDLLAPLVWYTIAMADFGKDWHQRSISP